jgi:adenine-specific DNA-methyltransferase
LAQPAYLGRQEVRPSESLLTEFAGKVNLIYIDPPFNVGSDFSFTATIADNPETEEDETTKFVKQPKLN